MKTDQSVKVSLYTRAMFGVSCLIINLIEWLLLVRVIFPDLWTAGRGIWGLLIFLIISLANNETDVLVARHLNLYGKKEITPDA